MNLKAIKQLAKTNLIYATPPKTITNYRKKQAKNPDKPMDIQNEILRTQLLLGALYVFLFAGLNSLSNPIGHNPALFANMVAVFSLFTLSQSFIAFYNVFYESKDLAAYRPYAFSEAEVILGKSVSVVITALMGLGPVIAYFIILPFQFGERLWLTIPFTLIVLAVLLVFLSLFIFVLVHYLTRLPFFKRYKNIIANLLLGMVSVLSAILYIFVSNHNAMDMVAGQQHTFVPPFEALYTMVTNPFSMEGALGFVGWIAAVGGLAAIIRWKILPNFYEAAIEISGTQNYKKRVRKIDVADTAKSIRRYQWSLLKEGSVWTQVILQSSFLPYFFFLPFAIGTHQRPDIYSNLVNMRYLAPLLLMVTLIAMLNSAVNSLLGIAFSLERENFDYMRVLPFDIHEYVDTKFKSLLVIQSVLPVSLLIVLCFIMQVPVLVAILLLITWLSLNFMFSARGYRRDYHHRVTNWSNIVDLQNRDRRIGVIILGVILFVATVSLMITGFVLLSFVSEIVAYTLGGVLLLVLSGGSLFHGRQQLKTLHDELENH